MAHPGWSPDLYDRHLGFASALGGGPVDLLDPHPGERVLDLGCGTGDLAEAIARRGATVVGLDASPETVRAARTKYPHLAFAVGRAEAFRAEQPFDAVFSNAALHGMRPPEPVVRAIRAALRPGGCLVAEFGARGNVQTVVAALEQALEEHGVPAAGRNPWYFPSARAYATLLGEHGFRVLVAAEWELPYCLDIS
jgi:trans-aconitate methyltransferase